MIKLILSITLPLTCFYAWSDNSCKSIDKVSWIIGDWRQTDVGKPNAKIAHENWQKVSELTLEGHGFSLDQNDKIVFQESLRIVEMQNQLFYLAKIKGNALPIAFKAKKCSQSTVLFENLSHDFPQLIHYSLKENKLTANISDAKGQGFILEFTAIQSSKR